MQRGYKVRIYPTKEQEEKLWEHINTCRFMWNYMLSLQKERYKNGEKHLSQFEMIKLIKPLKNDGEHGWLSNVSNTSLQRVCGDLSNAYKKFFNKTNGYPKLKSKKKTDKCYPVSCQEFYFQDNSFLNIEKVGKVRYKTDFTFSYGRHKRKYTNVRAFYENGKWFVSFGLECEKQVHDLTDKSMGIDLGVKELAVVAFGDEQIVYHNINKSRKVRELKQRIKKTQRSISRKYEANKQGEKYIKTNNIIREEEKLRKLYRHLTGIRQNYLHQITHELVSMLPRRVVMETLSVRGMMKNKYLSESVQEQCFYEFIRQMRYKCEANGIEFIQVDRFYPSSKMCSNCGHIKKDLKLSDRTYVCEECGAVIDRDFNAAINLSRCEA